jgi:zeaxanthin glucosyltransferase
LLKESAMANIAFLIEHEEGHLNPTFRLARRLADRGHRPVYLGLADGGDFVRGQGFEFVPILEDIFPRGTIRTQREMARAGETAEGDRRAAEIAAAAQPGPGSVYARSWRGLLTDQALDRTLGELRPDLFVLTSFYASHALILRNRYRLPIVLLTTILRTFPKSQYVAELGRLLMFSGKAKEMLINLVAGSGPVSRAAELAPRVMAQMLRMRELILCPRELELPGLAHEREPEVHYVEPTIDLDRRTEGSFPWEALDPWRRLLYISLGSQSHRAGRERVAAFLRAAAEAFAHRPEWQVVLSTGGLLDPSDIPAPQGGIVASWAPQLEILRRASVAVTHAGLGTVKECILCGVPMVLFPIDKDQPDNTRRVVHHGLGVSGDLRDFSAATIVSLVEQADHPAVRDNMARMRQCFLEAEKLANGVRLIEDLLDPADRDRS